MDVLVNEWRELNGNACKTRKNMRDARGSQTRRNFGVTDDEWWQLRMKATTDERDEKQN